MNVWSHGLYVFRFEPRYRFGRVRLLNRQDAAPLTPGVVSWRSLHDVSAGPRRSAAAKQLKAVNPPRIRKSECRNSDRLFPCKNFRVMESHILQFRAEFFNLFSHANLNNPTTNFFSGNFGRILSPTTAGLAALSYRALPQSLGTNLRIPRGLRYAGSHEDDNHDAYDAANHS